MELWLSLEQCRHSLYVVLTALFLSGTLHRLTMIYTYSIAYKFMSHDLVDLSFQRRLESRKGHYFGGLDSSLRWNDKHSYIELTLL
jgi:hypothetical protein